MYTTELIAVVTRTKAHKHQVKEDCVVEAMYPASSVKILHLKKGSLHLSTASTTIELSVSETEIKKILQFLYN